LSFPPPAKSVAPIIGGELAFLQSGRERGAAIHPSIHKEKPMDIDTNNHLHNELETKAGIPLDAVVKPAVRGLLA